MIKGLVCVVLLFAALISADRRHGPGGRPGGGKRPGPGYGKSCLDNNDQSIANICANSTSTPIQSFVSQIQGFFNTLQSNGSFGDVLADWTNVKTYVLSADSTTLLSTNCTAYFAGFNAAKTADQAAMKVKQEARKTAAKAYFTIIQSLCGAESSESGSD